MSATNGHTDGVSESVLPMAGYAPTFYGGFHSPDGYYQHDFPAGYGRGLPGWGGVDDRRGGRNRPFAWGDVDLDRMRSAGRWIANKNSLGVGAVNRLANYTVRTGYTFEAETARGLTRDRFAIEAARQVQACIDEVGSLNAVGEGGCEKVTWPQRQRNCVLEAVATGEVALRAFDQGNGVTLLRPVEAEQIRQDPATEDDPDTALGVRSAPGDVERVLAYQITYDGREFEEVPAEEVAHLTLNVPSTVKRGISDFFAVEEAFTSVAKLLRNMGIAAPIQAAVAWIEQHTGATQSQLSTFVGANRALNAPRYTHPFTGREEKHEYFPPGTVRHVNEGREFVPPPVPTGASTHIAIVQACLRSAAVRWDQPEYMLTGDASNANFSSTMVAGAPFVVNTECRQWIFGAYFVRVLWMAVRNAAKAGRFVVNGRRLSYADVCRLVDIVATPPLVALGDQAAQADIDHKDISVGVMSLQTRRERRGLSNEKERQRIAEEMPTRIAGRVTDIDPQGNPVSPQGKGPQQPGGPPAGPPTGLDRGPVREAKEEGAGDRRERAEMIADVLYGLYGDDALKLFTKASEQAGEARESRLHECAGAGLFEAWNELDHPRGEGGRFIPKGSAEAVSAATAAVNKAIRGDRTAGSAEEVAKHLANLTVKQLRAIWKEHGVQAGREVREALVRAVLERLPTGEGEKKDEKTAAGPDAEAARDALERYDNAASLPAVGGSLFGGDDARARAGFYKLPDGTRFVATEGERRGQLGTVKVEQSLDGSTRHVVQFDGDATTTPINPTSIEPLRPHLSWRTEAGAQPSAQGGLFTQYVSPRDKAASEKQQPAAGPGGRAAGAALSALAEAPVTDLGELRSRLNLPPAEFDKLMLDLHDSGDVVLSQDANPEAHSPEKLAGYVKDGGAVFTTATLSDAARDRLKGGASASAPAGDHPQNFGFPDLDAALAGASSPVEAIPLLYGESARLGVLQVATGRNVSKEVQDYLDRTLPAMSDADVDAVGKAMGFKQATRSLIRQSAEARIGGTLRSRMVHGGKAEREQAQQDLARMGWKGGGSPASATANRPAGAAQKPALTRVPEPARVEAETQKALGLKDQYRRHAAEAGVNFDDVHGHAEESRSLARQYVEQASAVIREAKALYQHYNGAPLTRGHKAFKSGDYNHLPKFDLIARTVAERFPEFLGDPDDDAARQKLYDFVAAGAPPMPSREDSYREALDYHVANRGAAPRRTPDEEVPF